MTPIVRALIAFVVTLVRGPACPCTWRSSRCSICSQFDAPAVVTSALGALGTGAGNADHATGQPAGDVSMLKNFKIREVATVQFRTEAFNPTASPHDSPRYQNNNATAPNFGSLVSVGGDDLDIFSSRVFQLALKLVC